MRGLLTQRAKHEAEHVEEMHADIGGDAARLCFIAFPRGVIPVAARGDVGQVANVAVIGRGHLLLQREDRRVQPQLQNRRNLAAGLLLDLRQTIDVPGIEHQRLFADRVRAGAQGEPNMGVVQIVGRADRDVVDSLVAPAQLVDVPVEPLEFGEETRPAENGCR